MNRESNSLDEKLPGFRLHRFEVLNWGTFDRKIWAIEPDGANSLLTGDIGTGKSTLIDALTTLLMPPNKITYNKAAGAEGRERTLPDYVLGHFKKEKEAEGLQARSISLRERGKAFTVLLAGFHDVNFNDSVTLAQVFWFREGVNQPERFYILSSEALTIEKDILIPGYDPLALKKKLKTLPSIDIFDSYTSYSAEFRRRMGISSPQAIDLLYQTVSMKSIGNLTDFVRGHMLDEFPVREKIEGLCRDFMNLNQAHESVLKARHQIEALSPMIEECNRHDETDKEIRDHKNARECLYSYIGAIQKDLLATKIDRLTDEKKRTLQRIEKTGRETLDSENARERLRRDIEDSGGRRLAELEQEINRLNDEKERRRNRNTFYAGLGQNLGLSLPSDDIHFHENLTIVKNKITEFESQQHNLRTEQVEMQMKLRSMQDTYDSIEKELNSLRARKTNIPSRNLEMREGLCTSLGVSETRIPFAGELLEIKENEEKWEGAIERVLHNFGLSLLVPDELYKDVSDYVDRTNLRGRLVYYRVRAVKDKKNASAGPGQLINKIRIRPDTDFYSWLEEEIGTRFDFICCDNLDDFRHHPKGMTAAGQIKSGGTRHEKDDRNDIHDRSRYILGWKNEQKISLLEQKSNLLAAEGQKIIDATQKLETNLNELNNLRDSARDISNITDFSEIDWQYISLRIEECTCEKKEIVESADTLRTLQEQLERVDAELAAIKEKNDRLRDELGSLNRDMIQSLELQDKALADFNSIDTSQRDEYFPRIKLFHDKEFPDRKMTLAGIDSFQKELRDHIQRQADNLTDQNKRRIERIIKQMQSYKESYKLETTEIDASIEAAGEYRKILDSLVSEDLPRHEERFKRLLRENTIQDIALFQNVMTRESIEIKNKISTINRSLKEIEYNRGSYIALIPQDTDDIEIRNFQQDLRLCLGETLSGDEGDAYTEAKFTQVKALVDRFQGRESFSELDKRWTAKVTDVRNWFLFSASENWIEDDSAREFYSDSSGKSGGQKEKLAYTILAAALAFQFSLAQDGLWNRSFRFVMIDEAFGRGSDESARYGLELFKKLQLQLLIVTPLQKIHIIENYVKTVHFVYQDGNRSLVGNMTIEEYRERKKEREQS